MAAQTKTIECGYCGTEFEPYPEDELIICPVCEREVDDHTD